MREFQLRLAKIALQAAQEYGFVIAGGQAVALSGIPDDIRLLRDEFTSWADEIDQGGYPPRLEPAGASAPSGAATCRVCHRALRSPESIARGAGPQCARKEQP
jgi:hypothetical protein